MRAQTEATARVVNQSPGGVLAGGIVEAASLALIERVRTAVSDNERQYKIVDLRPGAYTVTFMPTVFTLSSAKLSIWRPGSRQVNADLRMWRRQSPSHIGFRPLNVDSGVARLKTKVVKVPSEPQPVTLPNGTSIRPAFIEGPDAVRIELVQRR
jgi:hypothetical protein